MKTCIQIWNVLFVVSLLTGVNAWRCFKSTPTHPRRVIAGCGHNSCMIFINERGRYQGCACGHVRTGFKIYPEAIIYYCNAHYCNHAFP